MNKQNVESENGAAGFPLETTVMPNSESWVDARVSLPPENEKVLVCTHDRLLFCAVYQRLSRHIGENAPKDARWFASPGWGHDLKVAHWRVLPQLPLEA